MERHIKTPNPLEPPEPLGLNVVLEPMFIEVSVFVNEIVSIIARAFDKWEAKVTVDELNTYVVRIYRAYATVFRLEVKSVRGHSVRRVLELKKLASVIPAFSWKVLKKFGAMLVVKVRGITLSQPGGYA